MLGDLNVDFLKVINPLKDLLDVYNLTNKVSGPTCFKNPENPSSIDVILCNCPCRISSCLNECIGVSDCHNITVAASKMFAPKLPPKQIIYRSYKNYNEEDYIKDLQETPFQVADIFNDEEDKLWFHNKLLDEVINRHAPQKKRVRKARQLPYMNSELRKAINVKGMLKRKNDKYNNAYTFESFQVQRNKVTSLKRTSFNKYIDKRCNNTPKGGNRSQFWDIMGPFMMEKCKYSDNTQGGR